MIGQVATLRHELTDIATLHDQVTSTDLLRDRYAELAEDRRHDVVGPGEVAGVVFARAENDENVGYAMTTAELNPVIAQLGALSAPVESGACTTE